MPSKSEVMKSILDEAPVGTIYAVAWTGYTYTKTPYGWIADDWFTYCRNHGIFSRSVYHP